MDIFQKINFEAERGVKMNCYLCNEDCYEEDSHIKFGKKTISVHFECQEKAELEARMEKRDLHLE